MGLKTYHSHIYAPLALGGSQCIDDRWIINLQHYDVTSSDIIMFFFEVTTLAVLMLQSQLSYWHALGCSCPNCC
jgi:hypothetical protein